jgi:hypothetical protein
MHALHIVYITTQQHATDLQVELEMFSTQGPHCIKKNLSFLAWKEAFFERRVVLELAHVATVQAREDCVASQNKVEELYDKAKGLTVMVCSLFN